MPTIRAQAPSQLHLRPSVSVVVPFVGTDDELQELIARLEEMTLTGDDEVLVAWNSLAPPPMAGLVNTRVQIVTGSCEKSSYHARNLGVLASRNDWLLFIDGDCEPSRDLLAAYFADGEFPAATAVVGGGIIAASGDTLIERYTASRHHIDQVKTLAVKPMGYLQTANLLVQRSWWTALGGFTEGITSGGDADFCWRAQLAGAHLEYRPGAYVRHYHRRTLKTLGQQFDKYGRGVGWLNSRHPTLTIRMSPQKYVVLQLGNVVLGAVAALRGQWEEVEFRLLDLFCLAAYRRGHAKSNVAELFNA